MLMEENMEDRKLNVLMDKNGYPEFNYNYVFYVSKLDDELACGRKDLCKFYEWLQKDRKGKFELYTISYVAREFNGADVAREFNGAEDVFRIECDYSDTEERMSAGDIIFLGTDKVYGKPVIIRKDENKLCEKWQDYDGKSLPVSYDKLIEIADVEDFPTMHKMREERRKEREGLEGEIAARVYQTRALKEKEINEGYSFYRNLGKENPDQKKDQNME